MGNERCISVDIFTDKVGVEFIVIHLLPVVGFGEAKSNDDNDEDCSDDGDDNDGDNVRSVVWRVENLCRTDLLPPERVSGHDSGVCVSQDNLWKSGGSHFSKFSNTKDSRILIIESVSISHPLELVSDGSTEKSSNLGSWQMRLKKSSSEAIKLSDVVLSIELVQEIDNVGIVGDTVESGASGESVGLSCIIVETDSSVTCSLNVPIDTNKKE